MAVTNKALVLESLQTLPEDASFEDIRERVEFLAALQRGLDSLDEGPPVPHEEVRQGLAKWLRE